MTLSLTDSNIQDTFKKHFERLPAINQQKFETAYRKYKGTKLINIKNDCIAAKGNWGPALFREKNRKKQAAWEEKDQVHSVLSGAPYVHKLFDEKHQQDSK